MNTIKIDFEYFKKIVEDDIKADENELKNFLFSELSKLPVPKIEVSAGTYIERAVCVSKSTEDFDLSRLSYIPEHLKHITPKGRFNNAHEPAFYGAFTDFDNPENTRYYLASEIDQSILGQQDKTFNYTIGKWQSIRKFDSILFIFKEDYIHNKFIRSIYDSYINSNGYNSLTDNEKEFFRIITVELAKLKSANGYNITNIVFNYYKSKGHKSIIYPGIPSKYRGINIAMTPTIFDESFTFFMGAEICLTQNDHEIDISPVYKIEKKEGDKLIYSRFGDDEIGDIISISK